MPAQLTPFGAALAGALGGCFSNAAIYPLDTAKTRLQAFHNQKGHSKISLLKVLKQILREEGFSGYYRGFWATMLNTFSQQYAYFFFYSLVRGSYIRRLSAKLPKGSRAPTLSTAAELLLSALAGGLAQIFTIPVSVIATRQQIGSSLDKAKRRRDAESAFDSVSTPESSDIESASESGKVPYDDSFIGVAKEIVAEEGVGGLWLGIQPGLVLTANPAITYGCYERVKSALLLAQEKATGKVDTKLSTWMTFSIGAISKTLATIVTYPYIMAKIRIQARSADADEYKTTREEKPRPYHSHHERTHHIGALTLLHRVFLQEGIVGWYQGMSAQILKGVINQALLFLLKEQFEHWALAIMVILYRLRRKS
ncbi:adenine nucleotide transporter [Irpex rosettiformis]|uniref:Adenine nucleotide transporter n=1 Tax=Irpex rosettiformis TaxID=378272 RepID=A0ACB8UAB0_9APHY|nr:adenine nucleotide transporter [Irpex rosettiformis]